MGLSDQQISDIESSIGCVLPPDVRAAYKHSDGVLGPTDIYLLYPYHENRGYQIVSANELRQEDWFPQSFLNLSILGDDGCGNLICYDPETREALLWNPADGDWIQHRCPTVTALWHLIRKQYRESELELDGSS